MSLVAHGPLLFYFFQNNLKNLDLWDCLGRVKLVLYQYYIGVIQLFIVIVERGNPVL